MALLKRSPKAAPSKAGPSKGAAGKGAKGAPAKVKQPRGARLKQIKQAFVLTRKSDPKVLPLVLAAFFGPFLLLLAIGFVLDSPVLLGILGFMVGLLVATIVFGRRVQKTAYAQVEGQVGASTMVLGNLRGDWRMTPAVQLNQQQDFVHRVLGTAGVVLVAEGAPGRTRALLVNEKKRLSRLVGDTPVYDITVGDGEGQIPLRGLEKYFRGLPKNIKGKQVNELDRRLKAIAGTPSIPIPKGPMPRGGRVPRR